MVPYSSLRLARVPILLAMNGSSSVVDNNIVPSLTFQMIGIVVGAIIGIVLLCLCGSYGLYVLHHRRKNWKKRVVVEVFDDETMNNTSANRQLTGKTKSVEIATVANNSSVSMITSPREMSRESSMSVISPRLAATISPRLIHSPSATSILMDGNTFANISQTENSADRNHRHHRHFHRNNITTSSHSQSAETSVSMTSHSNHTPIPSVHITPPLSSTDA